MAACCSGVGCDGIGGLGTPPGGPGGLKGPPCILIRLPQDHSVLCFDEPEERVKKAFRLAHCCSRRWQRVCHDYSPKPNTTSRSWCRSEDRTKPGELGSHFVTAVPCSAPHFCRWVLRMFSEGAAVVAVFIILEVAPFEQGFAGLQV
jgi:hypothetical protein